MIRRNLIKNPRAKTNTSDWDDTVANPAASFSRISNWAAEGISSPVVNGETISTGFKVVPTASQYGSWAEVQTWIDLPAGYFTAQVTAYVPEFGAAFQLWAWSSVERPDVSAPMYIGHGPGAEGELDQWVTFQMSGHKLAGTYVAEFNVYAYSTATSDPPPLYWTSVMVDSGFTLGPYADGDSDGWEYEEDGTSTATAESSVIAPSSISAATINDLSATGNAVMEEYVARRGYPLDLKNPTEGQVVALKNMFV